VGCAPPTADAASRMVNGNPDALAFMPESRRFRKYNQQERRGVLVDMTGAKSRCHVAQWSPLGCRDVAAC
jgi:hypothetical protein